MSILQTGFSLGEPRRLLALVVTALRFLVVMSNSKCHLT